MRGERQLSGALLCASTGKQSDAIIRRSGGPLRSPLDGRHRKVVAFAAGGLERDEFARELRRLAAELERGEELLRNRWSAA